MDNFTHGKVLMKDCGQWYYDEPNNENNNNGIWSINLSTELTFLIKRAGEICKSYASDLFIDWKTIDIALHTRDFKGGKFLFGFRECGVDSFSYVIYRIECEHDYKETIKELYLLEFEVEGNNIYSTLSRARFNGEDW